MREPLVSVLVCTFDRARLVKRAVESALAQTERDLEVVLVDDGSTDGTAAWAKRAAEKDARLRYSRLPRNGGPAAARRLALSLARGRFCALLDSDDRWLPAHLESLLPRFEGKRVLAVFSNYDVVDGRGRLAARRAYDPSVLVQPGFARLTGLGRVPMTSTVVARSEALRVVGGFDAGFKRYYDDADLFYRLARRGGRAAFGFVDKATVVYRKHSAQLSAELPVEPTQERVERSLSSWNAMSGRARDVFFDWLHFRRKHAS